MRHSRADAYCVRDALTPARKACTRHSVRVQALSYRRLPGIVARAISSDTEPTSVFFSFCCLGLRASLLPFLFAMTASFLTAPRTAAWQLAARLIHGVKGMSLARRPRLHEPGLQACLGPPTEGKPV